MRASRPAQSIGLLLAMFLALGAGMAQAGIVAPTDISGTVLWLDANDPDGNGVPGGNYIVGGVATWRDKSAVGANHVTQGTAAAQPALVGGVIGGMPVMRFDGGDSLINPAPSGLPGGNAARTVFFVANSANSSGAHYVFAYGVGANGQTFAYDMGHNPQTRVVGFNDDFATGFLTSRSPNLWSVVYDGGAGGLVSPYRDGVLGTTSPRTYNTTGSGNLRIGDWVSGGITFNGDLAEVIMYNRALTPAEHTQVGEYLATKYNTLVTSYAPPQPVHQWTFNDGTAQDSIGPADGTLSGAASIGNGKLLVPGSGKMLTSPIGTAIGAKTLVVWTSLNDPTVSNKGSALTLENDAAGNVFDGIVYGELVAQRWMAGSDFWNRTQNPQTYGTAETERNPHEVMVAIAYGADNSINVYRNGVLYGSYTKGTLVNYDVSALVQIGPRHGSSADVYNGYVNEARVYAGALSASQIQAVWQAGIEPTGLIHQWTFLDGTARDSVGGAHGTLFNGATITGAGLQLDGVNDYMRTSAVPNTIAEKTLVAWVKLDNLTQQSGGVLTLENPNGADVFDSIVYGERTAGQWMSGSNGWARSDGVNNGGPLETSTGLVMMAIAYGPGGVVDIFRNGELYATYTTAGPVSYPGGIADVLLGVRHEDTAGGAGTPGGNDQFLAGWIDEARIYNHALTLSEVRFLFNQGPAVPEPGSWLLLATGAVGLAGVARLRRRRR